jgi:PIN domain nuclease of toxin-antitoxin system
VRLLLDTHAALWLLAADERLPANVFEEIVADRNEVLLSAAVVWEVAIKRAAGKLATPDAIESVLTMHGTVPLPITLEHASVIGELPLHHRDPFDRILVAQAQLEGAVLVSADKRLAAYGVAMLW